MSARPPVALLAVVALVGGGTAAATLLPPAATARPAATAAPPAPPAPARAPLRAVTLVCPDPRQDGDDLRSTVVAATPPGEGRGDLRAAPLAGGDTTTLLTARGRAAELADAAAPVLVGARGATAAVAVAEQLTRGETAADRGWAAVRCTAPASTAWYAGASGAPGTTSELLLANPGRTAALVDLTLLGPGGRLAPPGATGIVVPPRGRTSVPLDPLLAGTGPAAVRVAARGARVASAVRVRRVDGTSAAGVDWLPRVDAPAADVLLPGLPGGTAGRTLVVANPGPVPATVRAALVGLGGTAPVDGLRALRVAPGTTVAVPVPAGSHPAGLRVTADAPVLATLELDEGADGGDVSDIRETAYAGPAPALTGPAVLGAVALGPATATTLVLSAPSSAATVLVRALPVEGRPAPAVSPRRVEVPAGTTRSLALSEFFGDRTPGPVLVTPEGGPVWAGRVVRERGRRGPLVALLDLRTPEATVPVLAVEARPGLLGPGD